MRVRAQLYSRELHYPLAATIRKLYYRPPKPCRKLRNTAGNYITIRHHCRALYNHVENCITDNRAENRTILCITDQKPLRKLYNRARNCITDTCNNWHTGSGAGTILLSYHLRNHLFIYISLPYRFLYAVIEGLYSTSGSVDHCYLFP